MKELRILQPSVVCPPLARREYELLAADGAKLRVLEAGSGPVVLICLPVGIQYAPMEPVIEALAVDYNVLVAQTRWVSDDEVTELTPAHATNLSAHADDLVMIAHYFGVQRAHLIGYCSGALIALAAAGLLGPRAASLTVFNGAYALRSDGSDYEQEMQDLASRYAWRPKLASLIYPAIQQRMAVVGGASVDGSDFTHHFTQLRDLPTFLKFVQNIRGVFIDSSLQDLQPVSAPVLSLAGACDAMMPASQFDCIQHLVPYARHHVLATEDHYIPCRPQSQGIVLLREFLAKCAVPPSDEDSRPSAAMVTPL